MSLQPSDLFMLPPCTESIRILAEDPAFVVISKPTRLLSVPGRNPANHDSVMSRLSEIYGNLHLAHRLDFDTSGVMVIPLNKFALSHISQQFQARSVEKHYTALVAGIMKSDSGNIDLPIARAEGPRYKICHETGKQSFTEYQVLERDVSSNQTRVLLHPLTGRTHQLRLHLAALGHPILGCEFYGEDAQFKAPRLCLHARDLTFTHPISQERLTFEVASDF
jgi:tRNA pseudouridine32 synthase/23S rRNA pseudouridine746 synthase